MPLVVPSITTISIGQPEPFGFEGAAEWFDQPWTSGIFKRRVAGPVRADRLGLAGDRQADPTVHGGPDKAICVYSADHYPAWREALGVAEFGDGAFGENLTIRALTERDVCIGDTWSAGELLVQVSQPRQPCWKLARKWRIKTLTARTVESGKTGWYFRVLRDGLVAEGDSLTLQARPHPAWTVTAANGVMHHSIGDIRALASVEQLSGSWKQTLARRI